MRGPLGAHDSSMVNRILDHIRAFRSAAIEKADGVGGPRDRRLYDQLAKVYHSLMDLDTEGRRAFKDLLKDDSIHVRSWVAAALLHQGDPEVRAVLEAIKAVGGMTGFSAEMTLQEHDAGRLGPPLGRRGA